MKKEQEITIVDKVREIANNCCRWFSTYNSSFTDCAKAAFEMAEWKDEQPISEQGGWHTEEPTEDGWYLVDTPDFPKNCHCIVAEWDNDAKHFYSESSDSPVDFEKWKLIERN